MDPIFKAVLTNASEVELLLKSSPVLASSRVAEDLLIETIHWLYVGDTPLHLAAAALQVRAAKLLLDYGGDANAQNRRGATPLHYVCDPRPKSGGVWKPESQKDLIDLLIQHGARVEHVDRGGASALHRAVRARSPVAVGALLKAGARVDSRLKTRGSTPLHLAVQATGAGGTAGAIDEQLEIIRLLLQYGANSGAKDCKGQTVLDRATNERVRNALTTIGA